MIGYQWYVHTLLILIRFWSSWWDQGQKVLGQGQICNLEKKMFRVYSMNQWLGIDDTYENNKYRWDAEVDPK